MGMVINLQNSLEYKMSNYGFNESGKLNKIALYGLINPDCDADLPSLNIRSL